MSNSPNLTLPYILAAQAQKHITHNEALKRLDAVVQLSVKSRTATVPPPTPANGERYIVAAGATGAWSGQSNRVAAYQDGVWEFFVPSLGWLAWVEAESVLVTYAGSGWQIAFSTNPASRVGVNTTADTTNKLSVKSDAVLVSHDDVTPGTGDVRINLNKSSTVKTSSLIFQTGFSGRAEIGLAGDDKWRIKVSPDGSSWTDAMVIDDTLGRIGLGTASPTVRLHVNGGVRLGAYTVAGLPSAASSGAGTIVYVSNASGGSVVAFSDGTNWRRISDRTIVT
ncbi:MAG: DUF2793 domain-containing protein [Hyphomicrobium sp.]|nr:DUF2793 domain-containing protein [Hyphomicrobium sp.]